MCHGDLNCLWFFEARPVFNAVISYLSSAEWHVFFIPPPPLTQLAGTLHFEFSFLDYKGARNLSQSILKQAVTPRLTRNSSGSCCILGKEAHTVGTCPGKCLEAEQETPSLVKKSCVDLADEDSENREKIPLCKEGGVCTVNRTRGCWGCSRSCSRWASKIRTLSPGVPRLHHRGLNFDQCVGHFTWSQMWFDVCSISNREINQYHRRLHCCNIYRPVVQETSEHPIPWESMACRH